MDHSPLLVFVIVGMCLLVNCRGKPAKCDDVPSIADAEYEVYGNTAYYVCVCPATAVTCTQSSTSSAAVLVAVYDSSNEKWRNTHNNEPLACRVDGGWSHWSVWGTCTATCGASTQNRNRTCDSPARSNGGADCVGPAMETDACCLPPCSHYAKREGFGQSVHYVIFDSHIGDGVVACYTSVAVDGAWSDWSSWGTCTCDSSTQTRTRSCDSPAPSHGGEDCAGDDSQSM